ncbi:MAG: VOC family protein [Pseudonocardiaceae bacterium]
MTDPLDALREPITPVNPDPAFAAELRSRLEYALLAPEGTPMTSTVETPQHTPHTLGCYLAVNDARSALEFYEQAFAARRRGEPIVMEDGRIGHAELAIGDSVLMLADEFAEIGLLSPRTRGGPSQSLFLRVSEPGAVDATVRDAVEAGARLERAPADYDYGRNAVVVDPSGHRWMIASSPAATPTPRHGDLAYLTHAVTDTARARAFYGAVLGWTFRPGRVEDGWQIEGTYPPAGMHGGADQAGIEPVYQVDDLTVALAAVRDHGGQAGEPQQQPYGRIAECIDDQGAHFHLLQP